ncbi:MAG: redox-sensing transcriptional repressor Rex [Synergistaceae bacterium]|jgi:redox-sensing transcriptional repressor|nr:redox-sensing transcriptional repressor Rex [Synergistaceae bacterium]
MQGVSKGSPSISRQAIGRFPYYLKVLNGLNQECIECVSASTIAASLQFYEVQVRKDLAAVSRSAGKPGVGFPIKDLITDIKHALRYDNFDEAVLVGVGHLGKALLSYQGFGDYGFDIVAAFDTNPALQNTEFNGKTIFPLEKLNNLCKRLGVKIGIIATPANAAGEVCNLLVASGLLAIWNFAPVYLNVPPHVLVQNENMAASLALLFKHLSERDKE